MSAVQKPAGSESTAEDEPTREPERTESAENERTTAIRVQTYRPDHWWLAGAGALLSAGIGILFREEALLLCAAVVVGILGVRHAQGPPRPEIAVRRTISPPKPDRGETVTVETTIANRGERTLPDCRFVDRLPDELRVTAGSPRIATALRPGQERTFEYELEAEGGRHRFEGVHAVVSDWTGAYEHEYELDAPGEVRCRYESSPLQKPILRALTTPYAGRLATDNSGEGLEFFAVREYRSGDPLRRIDWNQYASSRELATLQFRTERSAAVVLLVDVRPDAYTRARQKDRHPVDRSVEAAGRLLVTLMGADHRVGLATLGPDFWLPPSDSPDHRTRALDALSEEPAFSSSPPDSKFPIRLRALRLLQRLTGPTQIILLTPLVDDMVEVPIQLLESAGHEVTVLSPDPTRTDIRGGVVATLERRQRIGRIHGYGAPVVDWGPDTALDIAVARTMEGWSQ